MNFNKLFLIGNITKDVELRTSQSGKKVATFGLATNRTWKDAQGNKKQQATFHNIVAWGNLGETINTYCHKGDMLMIEGRVENRSYEKKDGTKANISEVIVENFQFGPKINTEVKKEKEEELPVINEDEIDLEKEKMNNCVEEEVDLKDIPF
jgi:single-strand DNA-binding protein